MGFSSQATPSRSIPGYSPLLALGAVVHEWQHLLFRRQQLEEFARQLPARPSHGASSCLESSPILPRVSRSGALSASSRHWSRGGRCWGWESWRRRAGLAQENADDQHSIGYALVRALAAELPDPAATTKLLLRNAAQPSNLAKPASPARGRGGHTPGSPIVCSRSPPPRSWFPRSPSRSRTAFPTSSPAGF